jgi:hypothetical protein
MQALFLLLCRSGEALLRRPANPFPSGVSVSPADLPKKRPQAVQLGAINAGNDIDLRFPPFRQRLEEDCLSSPSQCHVPFT